MFLPQCGIKPTDWPAFISVTSPRPPYCVNQEKNKPSTSVCTHRFSRRLVKSQQITPTRAALPSLSLRLISPFLLVRTRKRCPLTFGWQERVATNATQTRMLPSGQTRIFAFRSLSGTCRARYDSSSACCVLGFVTRNYPPKHCIKKNLSCFFFFFFFF